MKIALYIEDGLEQIVLTPESETEKAILNKLHDQKRELSIKKGSFWDVRGGYKRYGVYYKDDTYGAFNEQNAESTMIVLRFPRDTTSNTFIAAPPPTPAAGSGEMKTEDKRDG